MVVKEGRLDKFNLRRFGAVENRFFVPSCAGPVSNASVPSTNLTHNTFNDYCSTCRTSEQRSLSHSALFWRRALDSFKCDLL